MTQIIQRRIGDRIEFRTASGACIATLFDGRDNIVFDPDADVFATFGLEPIVASEDYFTSIGLTVQTARAIDAARNPDPTA